MNRVALIVLSVSIATFSAGATGLAGFRSCLLDGEKGKRLAALCWYPAAPGSGSAMRVEDYILSALPPGSSREDARTSLAGVVSPVIRTPLGADALDAVLERPASALHNANLSGTRHPVVIVTGALDAPPYMLASLCERFAESGFLVVALPLSNGGTSRGYDAETLDELLLRLRSAVGGLGALADADPSRVALVGWSFGGVVNASLAMEDPSIDALVSLDCGVGYAYGWELFESRAGDGANAPLPPTLRVRALATTGVPRAEGFFRLKMREPLRTRDFGALRHADLATPYGEWIASHRSQTKEAAVELSEAREEAVAFLAGVMEPDVRPTDSSEVRVRQEVRAVQNAMLGAWNAGRLDSLMTHYDENAVILVEGAAPIRGRDGIASVSRAGIESGIRTTSLEPVDWWIDGRIVVVQANYTSLIPTTAGVREDRGSVLAVLERQADGRWLVVAESWTRSDE